MKRDNPISSTRLLVEFLGLAFGIAWTSALGLFAFDVELQSFTGLVVVVLTYMWAPAIAALIVQYRHRGTIHGMGIQLGSIRWILVAWLVPIPIVALVLVIALAVPGTEFTTDPIVFLLELGVSETDAEEALEALGSIPVPLWMLILIGGLQAGITINAVAAFGEELGWRGVLLGELAEFGFWKASVVIGVLWGVWHAPIIALGHNFPDQPMLGIVVMTGATVALSPLYTYVTVRSRSVLAPSVLHGTFNAIGPLSIMYVAGSLLVTSPVGIAGIFAATLLVFCCYVHDTVVASTPVMHHDPIQLWENESADRTSEL